MSHIFMDPCISASSFNHDHCCRKLVKMHEPEIAICTKKTTDLNGMLHVTSLNLHLASDCVQKQRPQQR